MDNDELIAEYEQRLRDEGAQAERERTADLVAAAREIVLGMEVSPPDTDRYLEDKVIAAAREFARVSGWVPSVVRKDWRKLLEAVSRLDAASCEPDGSWEKPYPQSWAGTVTGWVDHSVHRMHYEDGIQQNTNGPDAVRPAGQRCWDNGSVLAPGITSPDLPGAGSDAPWFKGFKGEGE